MKVAFAKPRSAGVSTLMYISDTDPGATEMPSNNELGVGAIGALIALFAKGTISRVAGGAVAGYIGYKTYKASR